MALLKMLDLSWKETCSTSTWNAQKQCLFVCGVSWQVPEQISKIVTKTISNAKQTAVKFSKIRTSLRATEQSNCKKMPKNKIPRSGFGLTIWMKYFHRCKQTSGTSIFFTTKHENSKKWKKKKKKKKKLFTL